MLACSPWLAQPGFLVLPGTTSPGLASIIHQENTPQPCPQANLMEANLLLGVSLLQICLGLCQVGKNPTSTLRLYSLTDIDSRHNRSHSDSGATVRAQQDEGPHGTNFQDTPQYPLPGLMNLGAPSHTELALHLEQQHLARLSLFFLDGRCPDDVMFYCSPCLASGSGQSRSKQVVKLPRIRKKEEKKKV